MTTITEAKISELRQLCEEARRCLGRTDPTMKFAEAAVEWMPVLLDMAERPLTLELETTAGERTRWANEADTLLWETMEGPYSVICVLLRDINRLIADNEAKAREIEKLDKVTDGIAETNAKLGAVVSSQIDEIARLKVRPTSEKVEELIHFHRSQSVSGFGNNDEDANWHARQVDLLRRLAAQSDGWKNPVPTIAPSAEDEA